MDIVAFSSLAASVYYITLATKLPKLAPIEPDLHKQMLHNEK